MIIYNEIEPYAAQWLRNLSKAGHIAGPASIDTRSIAELEADDVKQATQFHTFAGIGVWSYALRLAGWPDDAPVWTGSCPCQPFSVAGRRKGADDERHLFPVWRDLIAECLPPVVFGEQVASPDGRAWLDNVRAEMETMGYAFAAADLCAAGVGAPHQRQRLFFGAVRVGHPDMQRCKRIGVQLRQRAQGSNLPETHRASDPCGMGRRAGATEVPSSRDFWSKCDWIECADGVARPVEPGAFPLADGAANRVGRLRAYGNVIVPQVAAEFIQAFMDSGDRLASE